MGRLKERTAASVRHPSNTAKDFPTAWCGCSHTGEGGSAAPPWRSGQCKRVRMTCFAWTKPSHRLDIYTHKLHPPKKEAEEMQVLDREELQKFLIHGAQADEEKL